MPQRERHSFMVPDQRQSGTLSAHARQRVSGFACPNLAPEIGSVFHAQLPAQVPNRLTMPASRPWRPGNAGSDPHSAILPILEG